MGDADAVTVKIPSFWIHSPTAWFAQAEAQFVFLKITEDDTKYYYIVAALDSATATRTRSILSQPPTTRKYAKIKKFLASVYELSDYERASSLFNIRGLGDLKPSELMDNMLALIGSYTPCVLFKYLFLQQLPEYVRAPLSCSIIIDCMKLLDLNLFCLFCLSRFPIYNSVFFCSGFTLNTTSEMAHQFCATS